MTTPDPRPTIGLWTGTLDGVPARQAQDAAREIEAQGWQSLWFGEAYGREAFTNAALLLGGTSRMTIATGIASIYGRDAVAANAAARTLAHLKGVWAAGAKAPVQAMIKEITGAGGR